MSININKTTGFENGFVGASSAKPIVGHLVNTDFLNTIQQGKNNGDEIIVAGAPIAITNATGETEAGRGLNPNVFLVKKAAADGSDIAGFALASDSDLVTPDNSAPASYPTQIINIALIGSGAELYLPISSAATTLLTTAISLNSKIVYDNTAGSEGLKIDSTATEGYFKAVGNVVDGVKAKADGSGFETCKVLKVKI